jgi:hypothetical protein
MGFVASHGASVSRPSGYSILLLATAGGVVQGAVFALITAAVSASDVAGSGWSLKGNGALIVPFGLMPAVVAGELALIVLRMRRHPRAPLVAGIVLALGLVSLPLGLLALTVRAVTVYNLLAVGVLVWMPLAPVIAAFLPAPGAIGARLPSVLALLALPIATVIGFMIGSWLVPAG